MIASFFYITIYVIFQEFANQSTFRMGGLHRQSTYHETQQIRAYDFESLVGDVGGYMGLFLGYAILNLPNLFFAVKDSAQKIILKMKTQQRMDSEAMLV